MLRHLRILIVDDDELVLRTVRRVLNNANQPWTLEATVGGGAGMEAVHRGAFDVLVTDLDMPDVSGLQLLEIAARIAPDAYRILMTGSSASFDAGLAQHVVRKPDLAEILRAILAFAGADTH